MYLYLSMARLHFYISAYPEKLQDDTAKDDSEAEDKM